MSNIIIANHIINVTDDGLYSLNDLHKASGAEEKNKPANFMRLDTTQALADEINHSSYMRSEVNMPPTAEINQGADVRLAQKVIHGGPNRGTYVCKELVYAYAMWVSPAFHLKVIRTFDEVAQGQIKRPKHLLSEEVQARKLAATAKAFKAYQSVLKTVLTDKKPNSYSF